MDMFESKWLLDSPWSLEACKMEGILPHEILHIPWEDMAQSGAWKEIIDIWYEFNERKWAELINLIKVARNKLIQDLEKSKNSSINTSIIEKEKALVHRQFESLRKMKEMDIKRMKLDIITEEERHWLQEEKE